MTTSPHNKPKISVITVCFNAVGVIEPTILSVISQTYGDVEYIVVDGASTDGTVDVIRRYAGSIASFTSEPDGGIYEAMNKGIARATGDYIIFMNAGDRFYSPDSISRLFSAPEIAEGLDVIYGDTLCQVKDKFYKRRPAHHSPDIPTCHQSIFVATPLLKANPFNLEYKILGDRDSFATLRRLGCTFTYIPEYVAVYDTTGISNLLNRRFHRELRHLSGKKSTLLTFSLFRLKKAIVKMRDSSYGFLVRTFPRASRRLFPRYTANYFEFTHTYPLSHFSRQNQQDKKP